MIRQALVALGPKSVAAGVLVGGAALALGALFVPRAAMTPASGPDMLRLVLHAPDEPGAFYVSAWAEGDVFVPKSDAKIITFVRRGDEHDGCTWQGTERLTRMSPNVYAYSYGETILSCRPDAMPFRKTPRTGIVTAVPWSGPAKPTALTAIQAPGDLWNTTAMNDDCENDDESADDDSADDGRSDSLVDVDVDVEDAAQALADARRELADARREIADAMRQANDQLKAAALTTDDDE